MAMDTRSRKPAISHGEPAAPSPAWKPADIEGGRKTGTGILHQDARLDTEFISAFESPRLIPAGKADGANTWAPEGVHPAGIIQHFLPSAGRTAILASSATVATEKDIERYIRPVIKQTVSDSPSRAAWSPPDIAPQEMTGLAGADHSLHQSRKMVQQAQEELEKVREEAGRVLQEARDQARQIEQAAKEGGRKAAEEETHSMLSAAQAVFQEVSKWRDAMLAQSDRVVLDLVGEIAKAMFGKGVALEPEALRKAFERAMAEARSIGDLRVQVNPEDAMALGSDWWQHQQASLGGQRMELVASETVKRGGCYIEGEFGSVDARVESQLKTVLRTLGEEET